MLAVAKVDDGYGPAVCREAKVGLSGVGADVEDDGDLEREDDEEDERRLRLGVLVDGRRGQAVMSTRREKEENGKKGERV